MTARWFFQAAVSTSSRYGSALVVRMRRSVSVKVRQFVRNTLEYQRLKAAENAINTRAASNKAAELHAKHMTDRYADLVDHELRELRFRRH